MATTVIIPARNEAATIGAIVQAFDDSICNCEIFVGIDNKTTDKNHETARAVNHAGGYPIRTTVHGKGQVVWQTLQAASMMTKLSQRIVLCDGDYTGLTREHVYQIIERKHNGVHIGVPDYPEIDVPDHVINAWPHISGFRCLPLDLLPMNAHGYLLETQINLAAIEKRERFYYSFMNGLKSPFQWPLSEQRNAAREADRQWGVENGVFK